MRLVLWAYSQATKGLLVSISIGIITWVCLNHPFTVVGVVSMTEWQGWVSFVIALMNDEDSTHKNIGRVDTFFILDW
jgi:hypothetical protein